MSNIILCADDSKTMQTVAEITFRVSDYTYVGAMSADEAIQKAREQKPAMILADAIMPGKTGYDLCKMVKSDPALAGVPVILLCGNSAAYDAAKGSEAGVDGHLTKPWDTQVMLDKVTELLGKAGAPVAARPSASPIKPAAAALGSAATVPAIPTSPAATPKPPVVPQAVPPVRPAEAAQPGTGRTHTMMGLPAVMPPKPVKPAVTPPVPPVATPASQPPVTPSQAAKPAVMPPTTPAVTTPAVKPVATPPVSPLAKPAVTPVATPPVTPVAAVKPVAPAPAVAAKPAAPAPAVAAKPAAAVSSKYEAPSKKSTITQPGVPTPPLPARPSMMDLDDAPEAVTMVASPTPRATPAVAASPAQRRPPMIKGKPIRQPVFQQPRAAIAPLDGKIAAATSAAVAQAARMTGLDPSGPEMRALLALSKEVVERVVWEVVPDLAEAIIRENLDRLAAARR